jgi:hypothetical protein
MNDTIKLTRRRGERGENPCFILPPPRPPRLRVKLSSPSCCCTKPSPANCDIQNMSTQTTCPKNMAQKSKNIDMSILTRKENRAFLSMKP